MSLATLIANHVTNNVLGTTNRLSQTVTHRPLGVGANDTSVTALWQPITDSRDGRTGRKTEWGESHITGGILSVADSITVTDGEGGDHWVIDSLVYRTVHAFPKDAGMRRVEVIRNDSRNTRPKGRSVREF